MRSTRHAVLASACVVVALASATAHAQAPAPPTPTFPPGIDGAVRTSYYDVRGRTAPELAADMRAKGPKGDDGQIRTAFTDSRLRWVFVTSPEGTACRATDVRVTVSADVLMPRWAPPADTEPGLLSAWNQSMTALAVHEAGHTEILVRFARRIRARILAMRTRCDRLTTEANAASNAIVREMRTAQAKYDADTRNGLKQGTAFPPPGRRDTGSARRPLIRA